MPEGTFNNMFSRLQIPAYLAVSTASLLLVIRVYVFYPSIRCSPRNRYSRWKPESLSGIGIRPWWESRLVYGPSTVHFSF